jgi:hypothetical protein
MRNRQKSPGVLPALLTLIVLLVLALGIIALAMWPLLLPRLAPYLEGGPITPANATAPQANATALSPDALHYYRLKNLSCATLSKDFLIVTEDNSTGYINGLLYTLPEEEAIAQSFASSYDSDQETRTYSKGGETKKVITAMNESITLIWKEGRYYQCDGNCTMRLLGDAGWQSYLSSLDSMRTGCGYFGRTPLPAWANASRLLAISDAGARSMGGFTCEDFMIGGDKAYAGSLLSDPRLTENQTALIWGLAHRAGPIEECLDQGTGIIVLRNATLDLTGLYRFDYSPGGGMFVNQQTRLTYFSASVPESFLGLPQGG